MKIIIDGKKIKNILQIHQLFVDELNFPDYYGYNFDALYDCLSSINEDISICIINKTQLQVHLENQYDILEKILLRVSLENHNIKFKTL
jgi:RNAse (barnase) inhibitor barstar